MTPPTSTLTETGGALRTITLNRPERCNAVDLVLCVELADEIAAAMRDPAGGALVPTGAGGTCCAGGDVGILASPPDRVGPHRARQVLLFGQTLVAFAQRRRPGFGRSR